MKLPGCLIKPCAALCLALCLVSCASVPSSSSSSSNNDDTTPREYGEDEFPQWARDLRRFEIISLGSIPFLSIGVTLGYGGILYATGQVDSFPNPFSKTDQGYRRDDYLRMFAISCGAGAAVGLADLIINLVRRNAESKRLQALEEQEQIIVVPGGDEGEGDVPMEEQGGDEGEGGGGVPAEEQGVSEPADNELGN